MGEFSPIPKGSHPLRSGRFPGHRFPPMFSLTFYNPSEQGNTGEGPTLYTITGPTYLPLKIAFDALIMDGYFPRLWKGGKLIESPARAR